MKTKTKTKTKTKNEHYNKKLYEKKITDFLLHGSYGDDSHGSIG